MKVLVSLLLFLAACAHIPHESVGRVSILNLGGELGSATLFAVAPYELVTADHVCLAAKFNKAVLYTPELGSLTIMAESPASDLCLLKSRVRVKPLKIANYDEVKRDDKAFILGYPLGVGQILTEGTVAEPFWINGGVPYLLLSVPAMSGNSGSPIMNESNEVIGILVQGVPVYPQISVGTTGHDLKVFLDKAHGK